MSYIHIGVALHVVKIRLVLGRFRIAIRLKVANYEGKAVVTREIESFAKILVLYFTCNQ